MTKIVNLRKPRTEKVVCSGHLRITAKNEPKINRSNKKITSIRRNSCGKTDVFLHNGFAKSPTQKIVNNEKTPDPKR